MTAQAAFVMAPYARVREIWVGNTGGGVLLIQEYFRAHFKVLFVGLHNLFYSILIYNNILKGVYSKEIPSKNVIKIHFKPLRYLFHC